MSNLFVKKNFGYFVVRDNNNPTRQKRRSYFIFVHRKKKKDLSVMLVPIKS